MSVRERANKNDPVLCDPFLAIKRIIGMILLRVSAQSPLCRVFGLKRHGAKDPHTVIFVHALHLDLPSNTVVADAYVLPSTSNDDDPAIQEIFREIIALEHQCYLDISDEQTQAWNQFIPAVVERCRTWSHVETCKYLKRETPINQNLLCGCGRGKVSKAFMNSKWGRLSPFVTRLALSPLFAVSYLEDIILGSNIFSPSPTIGRLVCSRCNSAGEELKLCSRCKRARYCSKTCQNQDWKAHKSRCTL